jgi:hypothetical protein
MLLLVLLEVLLLLWRVLLARKPLLLLRCCSSRRGGLLLAFHHAPHVKEVAIDNLAVQARDGRINHAAVLELAERKVPARSDRAGGAGQGRSGCRRAAKLTD